MNVINLHKFNGKVPAYAIDIRRGTPYGNPYRSSIYGKDECLKLFEAYVIKRVQEDPAFRKLILDLNDKTLCCVCAPRRCHGHILANISFRLSIGEL